MDCIKYITNLETEIKVLEDIKIDTDCDVQEINEKINRKRAILNRCKKNLENLADDEICYRIYVYLLDGMSATKAIEKVAEENFFKNIKPATAQTL